MNLTSTSVCFLCLTDFIFASSLQDALEYKQYIIRIVMDIMNKNSKNTQHDRSY